MVPPNGGRIVHEVERIRPGWARRLFGSSRSMRQGLQQRDLIDRRARDVVEVNTRGTGLL
jgi:hypothetical protein